MWGGEQRAEDHVAKLYMVGAHTTIFDKTQSLRAIYVFIHILYNESFTNLKL